MNPVVMRGRLVSIGARPIAILVVLFWTIGGYVAGACGASDQTVALDGWSRALEWIDQNTEWGGHLRQRGSVTWPEADSILGDGSGDPLYDAATEFRLLNKTFATDRIVLEVHYELLGTIGDTRRRAQALPAVASETQGGFSGIGGPIDDDRRLFDLTHVLDAGDSHVATHRLDRLSISVDRNWGWAKIGRQALTWGNGLIFNPMDLFNPFAPTDIERDYKIGDDMAVVQITGGDWGSLQALHVARRDPETGDPDGDSASFAANYRTAFGTTELDFMGARHYTDYVVGIGAAGYLLDAAWRSDVTWTALESENRGGYLSAVVNLDYSWTAFGKNTYGLIEFFYSGIGDTDYPDALADAAVAERLKRGELFTLGRFYLAETVEIELHPLLRFAVTNITNLCDPSGILQPRMVWDALENVQLTVGATVSYGGADTEFGGFEIPSQGRVVAPSLSMFTWLTLFF